MTNPIPFNPGDRITHPEFGAGIVIEPPSDGYLRAFFSVGERRVPLATLHRALSRTERILQNVQGGTDRARRAWLALEAHILPIMESPPKYDPVSPHQSRCVSPGRFAAVCPALGAY